MQLCLGTVQFGLDYGITGQKKPPHEYAVECLDYATQNGILAIDTAAAYGTAEEVVGTFLAKKTIPRNKLFISTKLLPNILDECPPEDYKRVIQESLYRSLRRLHLDYIDAYLLHSARYAFREDILEALSAMQKEGLARKVGVSVYEPGEAMACLTSPYVDFIQAPYSIFDHRMKQDAVLDQVQNSKCELHTRSAFLQGLILMEEFQIPAYLERAKPIVRKIGMICKEAGVNRIALAMSYVKRESSISHLVFGVDSLEQLKEDISLFQQEIPSDLLAEMDKEFDGLAADIVIPSLWKK